MEPTDEDLARRIQEDDAVAFGHLYDRHVDRALRVATALGAGGAEAEGFVLDAFRHIWDDRHAPRDRSVRAWVMTTVRDHAVAGMRASGSKREGSALLVALRDLPDAQADVIVLAFFGGLTPSEIGGHLGLPEATVTGRMRLGLEKLRGHAATVA